MLDIFSRVSILAGEAINEKTKRDEFLRGFSLILKDYQIQEHSTELAIYDVSDIEVIKMYLGVKAVEGLSKASLRQYHDALRMLRNLIKKPVTKATSNDIRCALAMGMTQRNWKSCIANNYRRYWSAFFTWAADEKQIAENPMRQVKAIKGETHVRQPFSEEEMERLRNATTTIRERAILEFIFSTACRVAEVASLDLCNLSLPERCAKVIGKGRKERIVYLNAKAMLYLKEYLATRNDDCPAVFVATRHNSKKEIARIGISAFEIILRDLGKKAGVSNVHPHRFRHTAATFALRRGMPLEQVRQMLGHEKIETTLIYAKTNNESLRVNHDKFVI